MGTTHKGEVSTNGLRQYRTLAQETERTGLSSRQLRRFIENGDLPAWRFGPRGLRVLAEDVDKLAVRANAWAEVA